MKKNIYHYILISICLIFLTEPALASEFDINAVGNAFFDPLKTAAKTFVPYIIPFCGLPAVLLAQNGGAGTRFVYYLAGTCFAGLAWTSISASFLR